MECVVNTGIKEIDSGLQDQPSSLDSAAVLVENLSKSYMEGTAVLSNVFMKVEQGSIYSLLGASGSGKTTLLSCIVGLKSWSSGTVCVLGKTVTGPPGCDVGYMPQEIALYGDLSIRETIEYFGRLYGLPKYDIDKQFRWVTNFLKLPSKFKLVKDCSGGMKRRVSLAVAIFHNPKFLILDEPTVGLDPLLRENIWKYLQDISNTGRTILITTHYIEETRDSNKIGIMREGRMVVEESPKLLLAHYDCTLLEECILKIFKEMKGNSKLHISQDSSKEQSQNLTVLSKPQEPRSITNLGRNKSSVTNANIRSSVYARVAAFSVISWLQFFRHPLFLMGIILLPTSQMVLSFLILGATPKNIEFGIINLEVPEYDNCFQSNLSAHTDQTHCSFEFASCSLVRHLSSSKTLKLTAVESEDIAKARVHDGKMWGYIYFPHNYSTHFSNLVMARMFASNETLDGSRVHISMDMSHKLVTMFVTHDMYHSFFAFVKETAKSCGIDQQEFEPAFHVRPPVYGSNDLSFLEYFIPIILLSVVIEVPMLLTALLYVSDIQQGTLSRARVAGISFFEVMISYLVTQGSMIIVQGIVFSVIVNIFWGLRIDGPYWLFLFLFLFGGLGGGLVGLFFGVATENHIESLLIITWWAIYYLSYSGVYGPLEALTSWGKIIAYIMPAYGVVVPFSNVMYRGFGISHEIVWKGILQYSGWYIFWGVLSVVGFRLRQRYN